MRVREFALSDPPNLSLAGAVKPLAETPEDTCPTCRMSS